MIDFTKEGRVGDNVKSMRCGKGTIVAIGNCENETYPIVVAHDSGGQSSYTATGKHLEAYSHPSLMFDNGSVTIDQGTPPEREDEELYCGLTEAQWRRVINERFRVEVSDCQGVDWIGKTTTVLRRLTKVVPTDCYPYKTHLEQWTRARIPKEVGIRKPHFGGACPTKHDGLIAVKLHSGAWINITLENGRDVWIWRKGDERSTDIMEYIELP